jgi:hypothetical protein
VSSPRCRAPTFPDARSTKVEPPTAPEFDRKEYVIVSMPVALPAGSLMGAAKRTRPASICWSGRTWRIGSLRRRTTGWRRSPGTGASTYRRSTESSTSRSPSAGHRPLGGCDTSNGNSSVSVSLADDDHAVIVEGDVELFSHLPLAIIDMVAAINAHKYLQNCGDGQAGFRPSWALHPRHVYAWTLTSFPCRATRFDFATPALP